MLLETYYIRKHETVILHEALPRVASCQYNTATMPLPLLLGINCHKIIEVATVMTISGVMYRSLQYGTQGPKALKGTTSYGRGSDNRVAFAKFETQKGK